MPLISGKLCRGSLLEYNKSIQLLSSSWSLEVFWRRMPYHHLPVCFGLPWNWYSCVFRKTSLLLVIFCFKIICWTVAEFLSLYDMVPRSSPAEKTGPLTLSTCGSPGMPSYEKALIWYLKALKLYRNRIQHDDSLPTVHEGWTCNLYNLYINLTTDINYKLWSESSPKQLWTAASSLAGDKWLQCR